MTKEDKEFTKHLLNVKRSLEKLPKSSPYYHELRKTYRMLKLMDRIDKLYGMTWTPQVGQRINSLNEQLMKL